MNFLHWNKGRASAARNSAAGHPCAVLVEEQGSACMADNDGDSDEARANERVQTNAAGQVVLKRKTPWRDGTTHLVKSPLAFMQRLAALVPRPRLHLIRLLFAQLRCAK